MVTDTNDRRVSSGLCLHGDGETEDVDLSRYY